MFSVPSEMGELRGGVAPLFSGYLAFFQTGRSTEIKPRILVVEDDSVIADGMCAVLRSAGYSVHCSGDGAHAYAQLVTEPYDLLVLDLGLPRMDGLELLRRIRGQEMNLPVIVVSARIEIDERVRGLEAGANDYLIKPFDLKEFLARSSALLRVISRTRSDALRIGALELNPVLRKVSVDGVPVDLTPREYGILEVLMTHPDSVVSRDAMARILSLGHEELTDNLLAVNVSRVRKKIAAAGDCIRTVRGFGYLLQTNASRRSSGVI